MQSLRQCGIADDEEEPSKKAQQITKELRSSPPQGRSQESAPRVLFWSDWAPGSEAPKSAPRSVFWNAEGARMPKSALWRSLWDSLWSQVPSHSKETLFRALF